MMPLSVAQETADALTDGRPVVLLETAVLTCGLPRQPWQVDHGPLPSGVAADEPLHLATMQAMCQAIRAEGAVPAITAVLDGQPRLGIDSDDLNRLASDTAAGKASTATLALHLRPGAAAGTTVSGTLRLASALDVMGLPMPRIFATGGIGGVHQGWPDAPDISADLGEIARVPIGVVCAGPKSIIDASATCEFLEALGVPVIGFGVDRIPGFQSIEARGAPEIPLLDRPDDVAAVLRAHWSFPTAGGVLITQPPPFHVAMDPDALAAVAADAEEAVQVQGPARTPALLSHMASVTSGATLIANIELLISNAALAGRLARACVATS